VIDLQYSETSVLILRGVQTGVDRYNRPIYGPASQVTAECFWLPLSSTEDTAAAEQYMTGYRVQWPARFAAQIRGCDAIELPIGEFEVDGKPLVHPSMGALDGFVVANVKEVTG